LVGNVADAAERMEAAFRRHGCWPNSFPSPAGGLWQGSENQGASACLPAPLCPKGPGRAAGFPASAYNRFRAICVSVNLRQLERIQPPEAPGDLSAHEILLDRRSDFAFFVFTVRWALANASRSGSVTRFFLRPYPCPDETLSRWLLSMFFDSYTTNLNLPGLPPFSHFSDHDSLDATAAAKPAITFDCCQTHLRALAACRWPDSFRRDAVERQSCGVGEPHAPPLKAAASRESRASLLECSAWMSPEFAQQLPCDGLASALPASRGLASVGNPWAPTVHANFRYITKGDAPGSAAGPMLTPYYPYREDVDPLSKPGKAVANAAPAPVDYRIQGWLR